jgi:hypothetical protein
MLVKGMNGEGIESIEKTATEGFIDTYTITYTDGTKTTFDVTNGNWGIWTSAVTAAQGATSVTINNDAIGTTSILEVYSQNASGTVITVNDIDVSAGAAVLSFPALAEATAFILHIINGTASGGGGVATDDYLDLNNKPQINGNTLTGNKTAGDLGLQDELTFDNVPTDGSNNPVKSNGIYDSEKDIYAAMGEMGAKNLNSYPYNETSHTDNGVYWTDNEDGTVTANNEATGNSTFLCHARQSMSANRLIVPNGKYILTGCPTGGSDSTYRISVSITKNGSSFGLGIDYGDGVIITVNGDDNYQDKAVIQIGCDVRNGYTANNLTFKPMLRLASDTDDTYQPYAKTNRELTESYPANKVMMSDDVTSVEDALDGLYNGLIKIDTKTGSFTPSTTIPSYVAIEDAIFDDIQGYTIIGIVVASGSPSSVLFGGVSEYNITNGTNHKTLYAPYASRQTTATTYKVTIVRIKNDVIAS